MTKKQSATKKLLKILGGLFGLLIIMVIFAKMMGWMDRPEREFEVQTADAEIRTITQIVSASGRIQPEVEVTIRPDVSGEIIELNVREGDFVREGDLLLRIKPDIYEARIDELNAMLMSQRARMEEARAGKLQAESEYLKNKQMYERNLISDLEYTQSKNNFEARKSNFKAAEYQIESARAQLRRAEEELQQTVIRAPKNGTISKLAVERGERVLGQAQTAGTEMMRIARMEQMEINVDVNENDIVNVSISDTAEIQVDAYPNRSFEGLVTEIANSADITGSSSADQVTNYKVKIRITSPHNLDDAADNMIVQVADGETPERQFIANFKPGMSGTVDIKANTVYDVVAVPIQSVTVRNFAELKKNEDSENENARSNRPASAREDFRRVVFVNNNGLAEMRQVETGISDNTHIQVMNGLEAGEEVITGSYRILSRELEDGDKIKVTGSQQRQLAGGR